MSAALEQRILYLERRIERLERRRGGVPQAFGRSLMAADDSGPVQTVQTQLDALTWADGIPVLYHYGYFASPPIGTDFHLSFLDGDRSKAVIVASNNQDARFTGAALADAGLFAHGLLFHLTASGFLVTGNTTHTGNYTLNGDQHATGAVIGGYGGGDQVGLQTHFHPSNGAPPGPGS